MFFLQTSVIKIFEDVVGRIISRNILIIKTEKTREAKLQFPR